MDLVQVRERTRGERTLKHGKVRRKVEGGERVEPSSSILEVLMSLGIVF